MDLTEPAERKSPLLGQIGRAVPVGTPPVEDWRRMSVIEQVGRELPRWFRGGIRVRLMPPWMSDER